mgnify:CR=1 FL=1
MDTVELLKNGTILFRNEDEVHKCDFSGFNSIFSSILESNIGDGTIECIRIVRWMRLQSLSHKKGRPFERPLLRRKMGCSRVPDRNAGTFRKIIASLVTHASAYAAFSE